MKYRKLPEIAVEAYQLQVDMWKKRVKLMGTSDVDPINLLDPRVVARHLGYEYEQHESLGILPNRSNFEIAGILDRPGKKVLIADKFNSEQVRWTGAHEIGHLVLHEDLVSVHDRPMDGSKKDRDPYEFQADYFAGVFLMPAKLMYREFVARFPYPLIFDDNTIFWLQAEDCHPPWCASDYSRKGRDFRVFKVAKASRYNGREFVPLHQRFKVTAMAMAIRLKQLNFVT